MWEKVPEKKRATRGQPGLNRWPLDLQSNALPLSYAPEVITLLWNLIGQFCGTSWKVINIYQRIKDSVYFWNYPKLICSKIISDVTKWTFSGESRPWGIKGTRGGAVWFRLPYRLFFSPWFFRYYPTLDAFLDPPCFKCITLDHLLRKPQLKTNSKKPGLYGVLIVFHSRDRFYCLRISLCNLSCSADAAPTNRSLCTKWIRTSLRNKSDFICGLNSCGYIQNSKI